MNKEGQVGQTKPNKHKPKPKPKLKPIVNDKDNIITNNDAGMHEGQQQTNRSWTDIWWALLAIIHVCRVMRALIDTLDVVRV